MIFQAIPLSNPGAAMVNYRQCCLSHPMEFIRLFDFAIEETFANWSVAREAMVRIVLAAFYAEACAYPNNAQATLQVKVMFSFGYPTFEKVLTLEPSELQLQYRIGKILEHDLNEVFEAFYDLYLTSGSFKNELQSVVPRLREAKQEVKQDENP